MKIISYQGGGISLPSTYVDYRKAWYGFLSGSSDDFSSIEDGKQANNFQSGEKGAIGIFTKAMTDQVMEKTLPVDAKGLIDLSVRFNEFIDPYDPSSSLMAYSNILQKLQDSAYQRAMLDDAVKEARKNEAMHGPAIATDGCVWVKQKNKIIKKPVSKLKSSDNVVTVGELAYLRAYNDNFRYNMDAINAVDTATSMKQIQEHINSIVQNIGETESKQSAYVTREQAAQIQGLQGIQQASIDGVYKITVNIKDNREAALKLIDTVYKTLTNNQILYLTVLAKRFGVTAKDKNTQQSIDPVQALLMQFIQGKFKYTTNFELNFDKDQTSMQLGYDIFDKEGKGSSGKGMSDIDSSPVIEFFLQRGEKVPVDIQIGRVHLTGIGTQGRLEDSSGKPLGYVDLNAVVSSGHARGMNTNQMYFGSAKVDNASRNKVVVDGSSLINIALPIDPNSRELKPDFRFFEEATKAQKEVGNITDVNKINQIYRRHGLPNIYTVVNGQVVLTPKYKQFAVMHGFADRSALKETIGEVLDLETTIQKINNDDDLENIVELIRSSSDLNKKYRPTYDTWWSWVPGIGKPDIYEGSVFIPINENPSTYINTKHTIKQNEIMNDAFNNLGKQQKQRNVPPKINWGR